MRKFYLFKMSSFKLISWLIFLVKIKLRVIVKTLKESSNKQNSKYFKSTLNKTIIDVRKIILVMELISRSVLYIFICLIVSFNVVDLFIFPYFSFPKMYTFKEEKKEIFEILNKNKI